MTTNDMTPEPGSPDVLPTEEIPAEVSPTADAPTETLGITDAAPGLPGDEAPTEVSPTADAPTETLRATDAAATPGATPGDTMPLWTAGSDPRAGGTPDWRDAQSTEEARAAAGAPRPTSTPPSGGPEGAPTGRAGATVPPAQPVWTAASSAPQSNDPLPEAPFGSVRVGQLIWAGIVMIIGVFLIGMALIRNIDVPFLLIGLVAVLGVGLIIAAVVTSRRGRGTR